MCSNRTLKSVLTLRNFMIGSIAACGMLLAAPAFAQGISTRNVTVVVPFSAGSAPDILARRIGDAFQQRWKQAFVVENRPGASGNIGAAAVARAEPDGHTLMVSPSTLAMSPSLYKTLAFDPQKSFEPIAALVTIGFGLLVHQSAGPDAAGFVKKAKAEPGKLFFATPGRGTPHHLIMELFRQKAGINLTPMHATNFASAQTELLAGRVSAMFATLTVARGLPPDGSVRLSGVASASRLPNAPDAPTLGELGFAGIEVVDWYGLFAPAGTPQSIIAKFNATANEILTSPEAKSALAGQGMVPIGGTPERLRELVASDLTRWAAVVRDAGIARD